MYELTYGFTPFKGAKRDITFENIMKKPLVFPAKPEISAECKVSPEFQDTHMIKGAGID